MENNDRSFGWSDKIVTTMIMTTMDCGGGIIDDLGDGVAAFGTSYTASYASYSSDI